MNVLLLGEYGELNGAERSCLANLKAISKQNELKNTQANHGSNFQIGSSHVLNSLNFSALVPESSDFSFALNEIGITTEPIRLHNGRGQRLDLDEIRNLLSKTLINRDVDLVYANSLSMARIIGPVAARANIPSLGHVRDIVGLSKKAVADLNCNSQLVAVSNATREFHVKQGVDESKVEVINNGVDLDKFTPERSNDNDQFSLRKELGIPIDSFMFLAIGQIGIRKGVLDLVNGFIEFATSNANAHLIMVGTRHSSKQESVDYEKQIHQLVKSHRCNQCVHFLGKRDDVSQLMRQSHALVHCARQEPLGRVLLEATASGLPIIATDVGGTPEIFAKPYDRFVEWIRPGDANDVTQALEKVVQLTAEQRKEIALNFRQLAEARFSNMVSAGKIVDLIHKTIKHVNK